MKDFPIVIDGQRYYGQRVTRLTDGDLVIHVSDSPGGQLVGTHNPYDALRRIESQFGVVNDRLSLHIAAMAERGREQMKHRHKSRIITMLTDGMIIGYKYTVVTEQYVCRLGPDFMWWNAVRDWFEEHRKLGGR